MTENRLNERGAVDTVAIIGRVVGFLVVGVIGIYVGSSMLQAANMSVSNSALYSSQQTVIKTFELGITLCKIIVIVSVVAITFAILQQVGVIPGFREVGSDSYSSGGYQERTVEVPRPARPVQQSSPRQEPQPSPAQPVLEPDVEDHPKSRWQAIDINEGK